LQSLHDVDDDALNWLEQRLHSSTCEKWMNLGSNLAAIVYGRLHSGLLSARTVGMMHCKCAEVRLSRLSSCRRRRWLSAAARVARRDIQVGRHQSLDDVSCSCCIHITMLRIETSQAAGTSRQQYTALCGDVLILKEMWKQLHCESCDHERKDYSGNVCNYTCSDATKVETIQRFRELQKNSIVLVQ